LAERHAAFFNCVRVRGDVLLERLTNLPRQRTLPLLGELAQRLEGVLPNEDARTERG
jgi:hypothetical protein